jgi:hypothetical protein
MHAIQLHHGILYMKLKKGTMTTQSVLLLLPSPGDPRHLHQACAQLQCGGSAMALELAAPHAVAT